MRDVWYSRMADGGIEGYACVRACVRAGFREWERDGMGWDGMGWDVRGVIRVTEVGVEVA